MDTIQERAIKSMAKSIDDKLYECVVGALKHHGYVCENRYQYEQLLANMATNYIHGGLNTLSINNESICVFTETIPDTSIRSAGEFGYTFGFNTIKMEDSNTEEGGYVEGVD